MSAAADPAAGRRRLRGGDGARAGRHRRVPLRAARRTTSRRARPGPASCARRTSRRWSATRGGSLPDEAGSRLIERGESFAQLLTPTARVARRDRTARRRARCSPRDSARRAARRPLRRPAAGPRSRRAGCGCWRRPSGATAAAGARRRRDRARTAREALRSLRNELLIVGPIALLLATGLGYLLAGAGLRAVEAMRAPRRARSPPTSPASGCRSPPRATSCSASAPRSTRCSTACDAALERERGFVAEAGHELRTPLALMRAELDYALHYAADRGRAAGRDPHRQRRDRPARGRSPEPCCSSPPATGAGSHCAASRSTPPSCWTACASASPGARRSSGRPLVADARGDDHRRRRPPAARAGARQPRRQRAAPRRGRRRDGRRPRRRRGRAAASPTRAAASTPSSCRAPSSASAAAPAAAARDGSGLGLAIVQAIAEAHGGRAYAGNTPHGGAQVGIRLPEAATGEPSRPATEPAAGRQS